MMRCVLVVCTGNICRSPIGEALLTLKLKDNHSSIIVRSAGLAAMLDKPASSTARSLMQARGIDISGHRARQISSEMLFESDLILTMTTDQQQQIERQSPNVCGRVHRLGKWGGYDIPDPYHRPLVIFEQALALMDQGVSEWCERVWS